MVKTHYYFGYGSNLWGEQMIRRCPSAKKVMAYSLSGFILKFARTATIVESAHQNASVVGAIWAINGKDLIALDGYEGTRANVYKRIQITVPAETVGETKIVTYVKTDNYAEMPSEEYLARIYAGFHEWKLPCDKVMSALKRTERIIRSRRMQILNRAKEFEEGRFGNSLRRPEIVTPYYATGNGYVKVERSSSKLKKHGYYSSDAERASWANWEEEVCASMNRTSARESAQRLIPGLTPEEEEEYYDYRGEERIEI